MTFFDLLFLFACFCLIYKDLFEYYHFIYYGSLTRATNTTTAPKIVMKTPRDFFQMIKMQKKPKIKKW